MTALVALLAAATLSPFGLYHHVTAADAGPAAVHGFNLVTVRGDGGSTDGAVGQLLADKGDTKVLLYRRGTAVSDADGASHPEWLARDAGGKVVTSNAGGQVIDITKPAVRAPLVEGIARDARPYDGVYLDVLGAFFSARFYSGRPVIDGAPLTDAAWRDASVALITEVKAATGKPVIANGFGIQNGKNYADHRADADRLIAAADGIQVEQFVRNGNMGLDKYKPSARWQQDVDFIADVGRRGKIVLADTRVRETTDRDAVARQQEYALASFLVGAHGNARFRFAEGAATGTVDPAMAKTITDLGAPTGDAEVDGGEVVREFANGSVSVDPENHNVRIRVKNLTVTTAPPPKEDTTRFYVVGIAAAALLIAGLAFGLRRR